MVWVLQFKGVNDSATAPLVATSPYTPDGFEFKFKIMFNDFAPNNFRLAVELGKNGAGFGVGLRPDGQFRVRIRNGEFTVGAGALGVEYEFIFTQASGGGTRAVDVTVNGTPLISNNVSNTTYDNTWLLIGADNRGGNTEIDFYYASWQDLTTPANNALWDATASSHTAGTPILTDTIGGNNATGVNMPTDGSAWIDLGGTTPPTAIDLTYSDATLGMTADEMMLDELIELIFSDSTFGMTADEMSLTELINLVYSDATFGLTSNEIVLQKIVNLLFTDSTFGMTADEISLARTTNVEFSDSTLAMVADEISLQRITNLLFNDSTLGMTADQIELSANIILEYLDSTFGMTADEISIQRSTALVFDNSTFGMTADEISLARTTNVSYFDSSFNLNADEMTLITGSMPNLGLNDVKLINASISYKLQDNNLAYSLQDNNPIYKLN